MAATIGDLHQHDGTAVFPASRLQIRYAAKEGAKNRFRPDNGMRGQGGYTFYDDLVTAAPEKALTVPIWVTARVPAEAAPGDYEGKLIVTHGTDAPVAVPVTLTVCSWKSPDPKDFISHVGLIESPESVALKYKVPLWSDRHFALIGTVFEQLAQVGNKVLTVSAIENTQLGNYQSMVRFLQDGQRLTVDFSILDKYLEVYARHCPPPQVFYVYVWDNRFDVDKFGKWRSVSVTVVDKTTGNISSRQFTFNTPEAEAYFHQVMKGVRERAHKLGWKEDSIMLGMASDGRPSRVTTDLFQKIAPYAPLGPQLALVGQGDQRRRGGLHGHRGIAQEAGGHGLAQSENRHAVSARQARPRVFARALAIAGGVGPSQRSSRPRANWRRFLARGPARRERGAGNGQPRRMQRVDGQSEA